MGNGADVVVRLGQIAAQPESRRKALNELLLQVDRLLIRLAGGRRIAAALKIAEVVVGSRQIAAALRLVGLLQQRLCRWIAS